MGGGGAALVEILVKVQFFKEKRRKAIIYLDAGWFLWFSFPVARQGGSTERPFGFLGFSRG